MSNYGSSSGDRVDVVNMETRSTNALSPDDAKPASGISGTIGTELFKRNVVVNRPIYDEMTFNEGFPLKEEHTKPLLNRLKSYFTCTPCSQQLCRSFAIRYMPFLRTLIKYKPREYFMGDIFAGLTVGIMHIPQGMAYAMLAGLSPVYGLYVSFFPVLFYCVFGTSRHVSVGSFAIASLMVASAVDKEMANLKMNNSDWASLLHLNSTENAFAGDQYGTSNAGIAGAVPTTGPDSVEDERFLENILMQEKVKIAGSMSFLSGCIVLLMGILQMGWLAVYLSEPLVSGFTTGAAIHVFTSQIKHIFGISVDRVTGAFKVPKSYVSIFSHLHQTNFAALVTSVLCVLMLVLVKECVNARFKKKMPMPIPIELVVVVLGTMVSHLLNLEKKFHLVVVGDIPTGIPLPSLPESKHMGGVAGDAIAAGIICYAISVSMAKILAKKHRYDIDSNQEMIAQGMSNILSSFFSCYLSAASLSRSLIQSEMGGLTQVTGLVSSVLVLFVLLLVGPLFYSLPNCVLASIIMVALKGMFLQFLDLKKFWKISKYDFSIWVVSFLATALIDVDLGLCVALMFSILTVIVRSQKPVSAILGRIGKTDLYVSMDKYEQAFEVGGMKIFRYDSAIYFANAEDFKSLLYQKTGSDPVRLSLKRNKVTSKRRKMAKLREKAEKKEEKQINQLDKKLSISSHVLEIPNITITSDLHHSVSNSDLSKVTNGNGTPSANDKKNRKDSRAEHIDWPRFDIHHVILDCSTITYIDSVGTKCLETIINEYKECDVVVFLCNVRDELRLMLENTGMFERKCISQSALYMSIHDAVLAAQAKPDIKPKLTLEPSPELTHVTFTASLDNLSESQVDDDAVSNAEGDRLLNDDHDASRRE